jgi:ribosomal-protein-alanine N-acetyltransferase
VQRRTFLSKDWSCIESSLAAFRCFPMLKLSTCHVRSPRMEDASSLALHANNRKVWRNLRDLMPHPYSEADAVAFLEQATRQSPAVNFAIEVDGAAVGMVGIKLRDNIERVGAEIGYWLGEAYWGRGILSEVVPAFTRWAIDEFQLTRVEAIVFEWNPASARVLEKSGYVLEGTLRRSAIKDGVVIDRWMYAYVP